MRDLVRERVIEHIFDAVREAQTSNFTFQDFVTEAKASWVEALRQEIERVQDIREVKL